MNPLDLLAEWPVENAAAGWLGGTSRVERSPLSDQPFALASVTKPLFGLAVLVAVEEGTLHLDRPLGISGATLADHLAHTSGLGPEATDPTTEPRTRRIYSNAGYEAIGIALAEAGGMSCTQYFHEAIAEPLGLAATHLAGSPAHGATSSVDDLLLLCGEIMRPTLLSNQTISRATRAHLDQLDGVLPGYGRQQPNPWGLSFEIRGTKNPHWTGSNNSPSTFGHFGRAGTMLWIDPAADVACVALTNRSFGPWAQTAWPVLSDAILATRASGQQDPA
jgi:CubicO group peptidase (beta-lactamase class C family)